MVVCVLPWYDDLVVLVFLLSVCWRSGRRVKSLLKIEDLHWFIFRINTSCTVYAVYGFDSLKTNPGNAVDKARLVRSFPVRAYVVD